MRALLLLLGFALAVPHVGWAQPNGESTTASKVTLARRLYDEGVEAATKTRWSIAHERFKASYELSPRILTLFNLAGAQRETNRFVESSESYRRFMRETSDGRYPELRSEATIALEQIEKQIAQLTIIISNVQAGDAISIDDIEFPRTALGEPFPMNPGAHVVAVRRSGAPLASKSVTLAPGVAETVKLELAAGAPKVADLTVRNDPGSSVVSTRAPFDDRSAKRSSGGVLRSPWFWTGAVVVVAGGLTAAYLLTRPDDGVLVVR